MDNLAAEIICRISVSCKFNTIFGSFIYDLSIINKGPDQIWCAMVFWKPEIKGSEKINLFNFFKFKGFQVLDIMECIAYIIT